MRLLPGLLLLLLLAGCDTRRPATVAGALSRPPAADTLATVAAPAAGPAPALPARDYSRASFSLGDGPADTLVQLGCRHYWLSVGVATDSARPVYAPAVGLVGPAFLNPADSAAARPRVRGYYETYTFTLRDSARQRLVFRRQLHKADFRTVATPEVVAVMHLPRPCYLGYSAAQQVLAFSCVLGIPYSDVAARATLVLDATDGHLRHLSDGGSATWEAADCAPQLSPSGRCLLTCTELLRPGRPPLKLTRPHATLTVARFLTDTTLLLVYERGDYVPPPPTAEADSVDANVSAGFNNPEFQTTPAQRRLPTAYVLTTAGRELAHFRLAAGSDAIRHDLLRAYVPPLRAYLLAEEDSKLVLLPTAHPDSLRELPLRTLPRFRPPLRPHEQRYDIRGTFTDFAVYVDTLHPRRIRYRRRVMSY